MSYDARNDYGELYDASFHFVDGVEANNWEKAKMWYQFIANYKK